MHPNIRFRILETLPPEPPHTPSYRPIKRYLAHGRCSIEHMGAGPYSPYLMPARVPAFASALLLAPRRSAPSGDESSLPGVPDTDANTTDSLWYRVSVAMSSRGTSAKSGRRHGGRVGKTDSDAGKISPSVSAPQSLFDPSHSQVTPERARW